MTALNLILSFPLFTMSELSRRKTVQVLSVLVFALLTAFLAHSSRPCCCCAQGYFNKRLGRASTIHGLAGMAAIMASTYKAYLGEGLGPLEFIKQLKIPHPGRVRSAHTPSPAFLCFMLQCGTCSAGCSGPERELYLTVSG